MGPLRKTDWLGYLTLKEILTFNIVNCEMQQTNMRHRERLSLV